MFMRSITWSRVHLADPLHRNALFLMAANGLGSFFGFLFWLISARFYSVSEVGLAAALISVAGLLANISKIGFDFGLVRYLPRAQDRSGMINTCLTIAGLLSIVTVTVFFLGMRLWSPKLIFVKENWFYSSAFVVFTVVTVLSHLQAQAFVAFRATKFAFIQTVVSGLKLLLLVVLAFLGSFGIFASVGVASLLATVCGAFFLTVVSPGYRPFPVIGNAVDKEMFRFSLGTYLAGILASIPNLVVPLILINMLNPEATAYFSISFSISAILSMATLGISSSLFAEGSYEPIKLRAQVIRSFKFVGIFMVPGIVVFLFYGRWILSLFGNSYSQNSLSLLYLFAFSWLPNAVFTVYLAVAKVQKNIKAVICVDGAIAVLTLLTSYVFINHFGLIGVAIAFLVSESAVAVVAGLIMLRMAGLTPRIIARRLRRG